MFVINDLDFQQLLHISDRGCFSDYVLNELIEIFKRNLNPNWTSVNNYNYSNLGFYKQLCVADTNMNNLNESQRQEQKDCKIVSNEALCAALNNLNQQILQTMVVAIIGSIGNYSNKNGNIYFDIDKYLSIKGCKLVCHTAMGTSFINMSLGSFKTHKFRMQYCSSRKMTQDYGEKEKHLQLLKYSMDLFGKPCNYKYEDEKQENAKQEDQNKDVLFNYRRELKEREKFTNESTKNIYGIITLNAWLYKISDASWYSTKEKVNKAHRSLLANINAIMINKPSRETIRIIRSSYWMFSQKIMQDESINLLERFLLSKISLIFIGIYSFYFACIETLNVGNFEKYFSRFVINMIEPNVQFLYKISNVNQQEEQSIQILIKYVRGILHNSYLCLGKKEKGQQWNDGGTSYFKQTNLNKFCSFLQGRQQVFFEISSKWKQERNDTLDLIDQVFDSNTRNDQLYCKWKQLMCHKYCHFCYKNDMRLMRVKGLKRNVYYCNKTCQKNDFLRRKKPILHWIANVTQQMKITFYDRPLKLMFPTIHNTKTFLKNSGVATKKMTICILLILHIIDVYFVNCKTTTKKTNSNKTCLGKKQTTNNMPIKRYIKLQSLCGLFD